MRSKEADEVFTARSMLVAYAAANDLQAIDMLWTDFKDEEGLKASAEKGAKLGYDGKQIIHPNQIEIVQRVYLPSEEEVAHARKIIAVYEDYLKEGKGVFAMEGKMVDMPMVKAAQRLLVRADIEK